MCELLHRWERRREVRATGEGDGRARALQRDGRDNASSTVVTIGRVSR